MESIIFMFFECVSNFYCAVCNLLELLVVLLHLDVFICVTLKSELHLTSNILAYFDLNIVAFLIYRKMGAIYYLVEFCLAAFRYT